MHANHSRIPQNLLPWVVELKFSREKQEEMLPWWRIYIVDLDLLQIRSIGCCQQCSRLDSTSAQSTKNYHWRHKCKTCHWKKLIGLSYKVYKEVYLKYEFLSKFVSKFRRACNKMQYSSHNPWARSFSWMHSRRQDNDAFIFQILLKMKKK